jgi:hypothetical protein
MENTLLLDSLSLMKKCMSLFREWIIVKSIKNNIVLPHVFKAKPGIAWDAYGNMLFVEYSSDNYTRLNCYNAIDNTLGVVYEESSHQFTLNGNRILSINVELIPIYISRIQNQRIAHF